MVGVDAALKLHLNKDDDILLIRSCVEDRITIGEASYNNSLIVSPKRLFGRPEIG